MTGKSNPARMAMIEITTNSSINVKPRRRWWNWNSEFFIGEASVNCWTEMNECNVNWLGRLSVLGDLWFVKRRQTRTAPADLPGRRQLVSGPAPDGEG